MSVILFAIVFGFIGEIYVWHVDSFESTYTDVTFYLQKETSQEQMIQDIYHAADKNNVEVFTVGHEIKNIFSTSRIIYGTEGVKSHLNTHSEIKPGTFQSIFLGNVKVEFKSLAEIEDISQIELYQVIGEKDDIIEFKRTLVNQYAGRFPKEGTNSHENLFIVIAVWSVSLIFLLLMTLYEVALMKKEVMVRIICGESVAQIIIRNILADFVVFVAIITVIALTLSSLTTTTYFMNVTIIAIIIFLILNSIIYIFLYLTDYKKDMSSKESSKGVLKLSYVYKVMSIVLVIAAMSSCIELIYQGVSFYNQKSFFEEHKEYSYIVFGSHNYDVVEEISANVYQQFSQEENVFSLVDLETWGSDSDARYILANSKAIPYLQARIPEMENFPFKEKIYFIIPDKYSEQDTIQEEMKDLWSGYNTSNYDYEIVPYKKNVEIIRIGNTGKISTGFTKNPVIILNNLSTYDKNWAMNYISNSSLFKITDEEWDTLISEPDFESEIYYKTNAYDLYMHEWQLFKRNILIGTVLFAVLILLESIIIRTTIKYEYRVSAMELALKKVLGYRLFERYKKLLFTTWISGIVSLIIAAIVFYAIGQALTYLILAGISILLIEMIIMFYYIHKTDQINIQKILKGGNV
jgi:putative ABC transport system permease protein